MCFYDSETIDSLEGDEKAALKEILEDEEEYEIKEVESAKLKTSLNCLTVNYEPERKFAKILFQNILSSRQRKPI